MVNWYSIAHDSTHISALTYHFDPIRAGFRAVGIT
ncbi:unnamed protein product [Mycetohabitans rhizoxinica HKI 454]|uniref:Uncharacterized protein n=1 Tax=Mycetohabitans rhizoxinica (strain DSM 19002 / CIP 109453 / HKI 454) TaxID=882378 RepID=E5ARZ2_MYCRK|nr:unnamed protein product [Mycetohabitans rhizoxinica HKI 454]